MSSDTRNPNIEVVTLTRDDICWPWDEPPNLKVGRRSWKTSIKIDPVPAYGHDPELVSQELDRIADLFPVEWPVSVWILPSESTTRTNATTEVSNEYQYDDPRDDNGKYRSKTYGTIWLSGKRIPPHPAMTRYLVAHEYGHVVEEWLNVQAGNNVNDGKLLKRYAELRGMSSPAYYGAGTWHCSPGELFANDFRLLVCKSETEFWPHFDIPRPEDLPEIVKFWELHAI